MFKSKIALEALNMLTLQILLVGLLIRKNDTGGKFVLILLYTAARCL